MGVHAAAGEAMTRRAVEVDPEKDAQEQQQVATVVRNNAITVAESYQIVRFRGRAMIRIDVPFPHFVPLHKERFDQIAYPILGGVTRSRMQDVFAYLSHTAEDLTHNEHLVAFGVPASVLVAARLPVDVELIQANPPVVWDMDELRVRDDVSVEQCVWRSPYPLIEGDGKRLPFVMQLAGQDPGKYDDIMQSLAPLLMGKKPDGAMWWIGDGANGKSTLMDAIYRIFPGQLSSLTVKRLVDGRDTPSLNGTLGNVVKESSEGRIEDTEIYKAIGTHENFRVHKFHSQDDIEINGNMHHIFSANSVPIFNDKGWSARRRTFIVPFSQTFESDPTFEDKVFTTDMFGRLASEMCKYAVQLKKQAYRYKWSADTREAKMEYDTDANNAEEYAKHLVQMGVVGFESFSPVQMHYENWCRDEGYVALGVRNLRRAVTSAGYGRVSVRRGDGVEKEYRLPDIAAADIRTMGMGQPGFYTMMGFSDVEAAHPEAAHPDPEIPEQTKLGGGW